MDRVQALESAVRTLGPGQQARLAVDLASLVEPFAQLSPKGQPEEGLPAVGQAIRAATTMAEVDLARHRLWSTPELQIDDGEPEDASWFSFGATIAWIYAADSRCTAPVDGVLNALERVLDLLDAADQTLGDTDLVGLVLVAVELAVQEQAVRLPIDEFGPQIAAAVRRLTPIA